MGKHVVGRAISIKLNGRLLEMVGSFKLNLGGDENERIEGNHTVKIKKKFVPAEIEGEAIKTKDLNLSELKATEDGIIEAIGGDGTVYVLRDVYAEGNFQIDTSENKFTYKFFSPYAAEEL